MILHTYLLLAASGVRVGVLGEGQLRFLANGKALFAASATLVPNAAGLLADAAGHPVLPPIKIGTGAFRIAMNGTVTVAGKSVGRLVLYRAGGDVGMPGEGTFGVLSTTTSPLPATRSERAAPSPQPVSPREERAADIRVLVQGADDVPGDRVLLRDVAKIVGDPATAARLGEIDLGVTPVIGVHRSLGEWAIRAALRGTEFENVAFKVLPDATVARRSQTVEASAITAEARRVAQGIVGKDDVRYESGPAPLKAVCGMVTFEHEVGKNVNDQLPITVVIFVDGKEVGRRKLTFAVHLDGVKAGDAVRVTLTRNGAVLETDAKARTAGVVGETVQIATTEGATLTAKVTGVGTVEVDL